jgi:hypothetical protein
MKKNLVMVLALVVVLGMMMIGCGSKNDSKYVGTTWSLAAFEAEGMKIEGEDATSTMGECIIDFKSDEVSLTLGGEKYKGDWSEKNDVITIESDGESMECNFEDSQLVMEQDGVKLYFEKK